MITEVGKKYYADCTLGAHSYVYGSAVNTSTDGTRRAYGYPPSTAFHPEYTDIFKASNFASGCYLVCGSGNTGDENSYWLSGNEVTYTMSTTSCVAGVDDYGPFLSVTLPLVEDERTIGEFAVIASTRAGVHVSAYTYMLQYVPLPEKITIPAGRQKTFIFRFNGNELTV